MQQGCNRSSNPVLKDFGSVDQFRSDGIHSLLDSFAGLEQIAILIEWLGHARVSHAAHSVCHSRSRRC
jgi:hypothetical protein